MKWRRVVPTSITLGILFLGFLSVLRSVSGEYAAAAQLIFLAAILDGLDGEVARLFRGVTTFGAKLDTYVDTVAFGIAPAVLAYQAVWSDLGTVGTLFAYSIVASGVLRFARYAVKESRVKSQTYRGLPIPVSALWIAMIVLLTESDILMNGWFFIDQHSVAVFMWACTILFLVLQLSNVRYAKPTREMLVWGLGTTFALMMLWRNPKLGFCVGTCASLFVFALYVPFYVHARIPEEDDEQKEERVRVRR